MKGGAQNPDCVRSVPAFTGISRGLSCAHFVQLLQLCASSYQLWRLSHLLVGSSMSPLQSGVRDELRGAPLYHKRLAFQAQGLCVFFSYASGMFLLGMFYILSKSSLSEIVKVVHSGMLQCPHSVVKPNTSVPRFNDDIFGSLTRRGCVKRTICRMMPEGEAETFALFVVRFSSLFLCSFLLVGWQVEHMFVVSDLDLGRWAEFVVGRPHVKAILQ